jgi:hypothetical protein
MGFRISWIGFEKVLAADVLTMAGMRDTCEPGLPYEVPSAIAELATGWTILFSDDFTYAHEGRLRDLSGARPAARMLGVQVHEGMMASAARCFRDAAVVWMVEHDTEVSLTHLWTHGDLPAAFGAIKALQSDKQAREDAALAPAETTVDHIFDVPVLLAESVTGFRHDRDSFDWGTPRFTRIERR